MTQFLTKEWVEEVQKALDFSEPLAKAVGTANAIVQQVVTDARDGEVHYYIKVADGRAEVILGDAEGATLTLTTDYDTAAKINRGETTGQAALMGGKLKVGGDMMKLMTLQGPVQAIDSAVKTVATEY